MRIFSLVLVITSLIVIPYANSSEKREIRKFCKKTRNYSKCIKEFNGYEKARIIPKKGTPIEIMVIPYKD